jgi:hypothetical protein
MIPTAALNRLNRLCPALLPFLSCSTERSVGVCNGVNDRIAGGPCAPRVLEDR